jgi:hypothetical protein
VSHHLRSRNRKANTIKARPTTTAKAPISCARNGTFASPYLERPELVEPLGSSGSYESILSQDHELQPDNLSIPDYVASRGARLEGILGRVSDAPLREGNRLALLNLEPSAP